MTVNEAIHAHYKVRNLMAFLTETQETCTVCHVIVRPRSVMSECWCCGTLTCSERCRIECGHCSSEVCPDCIGPNGTSCGRCVGDSDCEDTDCDSSSDRE